MQQLQSSFKDYLTSIVKECIRVCNNLHTDSFSEEWFILSGELARLKADSY